MQETQRRLRGHSFYPKSAPALYSQDGKGQDALAVAHYFTVTGADWYVTEMDADTGEAFGWAELLPGCGELGYFSLPEMEALHVAKPGYGVVIVEREVDWEPVPLRDAIAARNRILFA